MQTYGAGGSRLVKRRRRAARTRRRAAIISAGILGLALLAADIYVAVAPEYQLRQPDRPSAPPRIVAEATATASSQPDAPAQPVAAEAKRINAAPSSPAKIIGAPSLKTIPAAESPIALAAALTGETSGVTDAGDGRKPGGVTSLQGFDTVVALGLLGSPGGGNGGGGTTPPDGETDPPGGGGGTEPPGGGGGTEPPVLATPIPSAFFLFGAALAGLTISRRRRRM